MNTKFFLLLAASLILANPTTSANLHFKNESPVILAAEAPVQNIVSVSEIKGSTQNIPTVALLRITVRSRKDEYIIDDDGKFHHVHYERMPEHRFRRLLCIILSASLLSIVYLCTIIANHLHLVH